MADLYGAAPFYRWYMGPMSREQSESVMQNSLEQRAFFVRQNVSGDMNYILVLKLPGEPLRHCRVHVFDGQYQLDGAPKSFPDLLGVVTDYMNVMQVVAVDRQGLAVSVGSQASPSAPAFPSQQNVPAPYPVPGPPLSAGHPSFQPAPTGFGNPSAAPPSYNDVVGQTPAVVVPPTTAPAPAPVPVARHEPNCSVSSEPGYQQSVYPSPTTDGPSSCNSDCCVSCMCQCDTDSYKWYDPRGKGFFVLLALFVIYIIFGAIFLAFAIIACAFFMVCGSSD